MIKGVVNMKKILFGIIIGIILSSSVAFGTDIIRNSYFNSDLKLAINNHQVSDIRIVTVELEGEQYGRNYYSIADLIKAINDYGGISAKVDFDSATKTTIVEIGEGVAENINNNHTQTPIVTPIPTPTTAPYTQYIPDPNPSIEPTPTPISKSTLDGESNPENDEKGGSNNSVQLEILTNITDYNFNEETGEETFASNGVKYITGHSLSTIIEKNKYLSIFIKSGNKSYIHKKYDMGNVLLSNIPSKIYKDVNGNFRACFEYDYYLNTLLPFIEGWTE